MRVGVVGAGSFGTSLASLLAGKGYEVRLWAREEALVRSINDTRENGTYLPGFKLPPTLTATHVLEEAVEGRDMVVMATPSHAAREVAGRLKGALPKNVPIVTVSKGIENESLLTMTEVLEEALPVEFHPYLAVLSGPSFAREIAQKLPTAVTVASVWPRVA
ncbi:MAG: NAD(P)H-dependent glycerol-3-phosphate dehydrogenase, partial [Myxococcales bacterium]